MLIAAQRPDGRWRQAVPIWVVTVGEDVVVRSRHRRDTGWFGDAVRTGRARVDVPGLSTDVVVADVGADDQAAARRRRRRLPGEVRAGGCRVDGHRRGRRHHAAAPPGAGAFVGTVPGW
nr:DUF2255 family protein [Angustibacter aerolatus]